MKMTPEEEREYAEESRALTHKLLETINGSKPIVAFMSAAEVLEITANVLSGCGATPKDCRNIKRMIISHLNETAQRINGVDFAGSMLFNYILNDE